jgi:hypothetical protein
MITAEKLIEYLSKCKPDTQVMLCLRDDGLSRMAFLKEIEYKPEVDGWEEDITLVA